jgi:hypothetical protein
MIYTFLGFSNVGKRWKALDRESFERSPFVEILTGYSGIAEDKDIRAWDSHSPERRLQLANQATEEPDASARNMKIFGIVRQWAAVDPEANVAWLESLPEENRANWYKASVAASAPEHLELTLNQADRFPLIQREACLVTAFHAWTKAHSGERADRTSWPAERITAWEDLEALLPDEEP